MSFNQTQQLLNLVSRSFALCIPMLPEKVKEQVGNFYLLCRYADSIEDSKLTNEQKTLFFKRYLTAVKKEDIKIITLLNTELVPFVISKNDKKMIKVFNRVLSEFSLFDKTTKTISKKWLSCMVRGMQKYSKKEIESFSDLNNYCYFVAGTVGMYLTDIFVYKFELKEEQKELLKRAKSFGLLLQKVNIIRDFSKDHSEGRVFWPKHLFTKHELTVNDSFDKKNSLKSKKILKAMVTNAKTNMQHAIEYIQLLPKEEKGLRLFCAIPLCMAIPTLAKCEDNNKIFEFGEKVKMDRTETLILINKVKQNITDDAFFSEYGKTINTSEKIITTKAK